MFNLAAHSAHVEGFRKRGTVARRAELDLGATAPGETNDPGRTASDQQVSILLCCTYSLETADSGRQQTGQCDLRRVQSSSRVAGRCRPLNFADGLPQCWSPGWISTDDG